MDELNEQVNITRQLMQEMYAPKQQVLAEAKGGLGHSDHHAVFTALGLKHKKSEDEGHDEEGHCVSHTYTGVHNTHAETAHIHDKLEDLGYVKDDHDHDAGGEMHAYSHPKKPGSVVVTHSHDRKNRKVGVTHWSYKK